MAEPHEQAEPDASNTQEKRVIGRPFEKGNQLGKLSGGGRKHNIERQVRDMVEIGDDQNLLLEVMLQHATGWRCLIHPTKKDAKTKSGMVETWQEVSVSDQREAVKYLTDRGYGKVKDVVNIEVTETDTGPDIRAFSTDFRAAVDELTQRRRQREAAEAEAAAQ